MKSRIYPEKSRIITTCSAVNGHIALVLLLFFVLFFIERLCEVQILIKVNITNCKNQIIIRYTNETALQKL